MDIDFEKHHGLVPAIIQDTFTKEVLMLGFMNREALERTQKEGKVTFFSRTKGRLWTKGETSGNFLKVVKIIPDCDEDTLLILVQPQGPVCHTGNDTCFGNKKNQGRDLSFLEDVILDRKKNPQESSYTNQLLQKGINKVAQKVGEEAVELVIEAKDNDLELFKNEAADLIYHYLVLLAAKEVSFAEVIEVLRQRHK